MYIHFLSNYDDEKLIYRRNLAEIKCFYLYLYNNRNHKIFMIYVQKFIFKTVLLNVEKFFLFKKKIFISCDFTKKTFRIFFIDYKETYSSFG